MTCSARPKGCQRAGHALAHGRAGDRLGGADRQREGVTPLAREVLVDQPGPGVSGGEAVVGGRAELHPQDDQTAEDGHSSGQCQPPVPVAGTSDPAEQSGCGGPGGLAPDVARWRVIVAGAGVLAGRWICQCHRSLVVSGTRRVWGKRSDWVSGFRMRIGSHRCAPFAASPGPSRRTEIRHSPRSRTLASTPCSAG